MLTNPKQLFNRELHAYQLQEKKLEQADLVWSRITLEPGEVLFVKVAIAAAGDIGAIAETVEKAFGPVNQHRVLVYVEGTLELNKVAP